MALSTLHGNEVGRPKMPKKNMKKIKHYYYEQGFILCLIKINGTSITITLENLLILQFQKIMSKKLPGNKTPHAIKSFKILTITHRMRSRPQH